METPYKLNTKIKNLPLSARTKNTLIRAGIESAKDLVQHSKAYLVSYKNVSESSILEIQELLHANGFSLGMNTTTVTTDNTLQKIEQLEADKKELLEVLGKCWEILPLDTPKRKQLFEKVESLIQKMKP